VKQKVKISMPNLSIFSFLHNFRNIKDDSPLLKHTKGMEISSSGELDLV
jgi:hypothetical protein